jgi:hypothetical protein
MARGLATLVLVAAALAAPASGTIGSVISSFYIPDTARNGIYRESNYVHTVQKDGGYNYIRTYNTSGSYLSRVAIDGWNEIALYSGSRTHLGTAYIALCDREDNLLKIFSVTRGGAPVASFTVMNGPYNCFWSGEYYYVNPREDKGRFVRYTRNGASAGAWTCSGWPAIMPLCGGATYAQCGNNSKGPYFVASPDTSGRPCCITTFPGGSLVRTWMVPGREVKHLAYGDSTQPGTYGAAVWAILNNPWMVVEFDIDARNASAVLPISIGKVKAIYR